MDQIIPLSQKLYLLGIHPEKGGIVMASGSVMNYILPGALILELFLNRNISFEQKKVVYLNDKTSVSIHRFLLDKIKQKSSPISISRWIHKFQFSQKQIRREVQQGLVEKRIITLQPKQFLFFRWNKPELVNRQIVYHLLSDIENQIFKGTDVEEEILFLSMIKPARLLKRIFPEREKRKQAEDRLKLMLLENQVSTAVSQAIAAAHAVAASVVISTATHH